MLYYSNMQAKNSFIIVRVGVDLKKKVEQKAKKGRQTISDYIRKVIEDAVIL